jgi:hypothetical protein
MLQRVGNRSFVAFLDRPCEGRLDPPASALEIVGLQEPESKRGAQPIAHHGRRCYSLDRKRAIHRERLAGLELEADVRVEHERLDDGAGIGELRQQAFRLPRVLPGETPVDVLDGCVQRMAIHEQLRIAHRVQ